MESTGGSGGAHRAPSVSNRPRTCYTTATISHTVMPGLVPGIHAFAARQDVDGRDKPGHDGGES
jgi:hypothetical protein